MKKLLTKVAILIAGLSGVAVAQQDPQFTQWMQNKLIYNPGYAGTSGGYCGVVQYRKQWASFDGAPTTINFAGDARVGSLPLGVGLVVMNDKIGTMNTNFIRVGGTWLPLIGKHTLGLGLDFGFLQKRISGDWITPQPFATDPLIPTNFNKGTFDLGFGAYYKYTSATQQFYFGASSSHLPAETITSDNSSFDVSRHYYVMTGYNYQFNAWNALGVNVKYKSDLAGSALDLNINYTFNIANNQKLWVGPTFRPNDAAAILAGYSYTDQKANSDITYRGGVSYDFVLSQLKGYTSGSFELFLGVCYTPKPKKITTYESDRFF